ncbi:MAG: hypothetical protein KIT11_09440 [Fimbriimonadaceae bacterium]|nr:hypothetical protein [Fimbriimonadaceae bacterium]QYK55550.1 MAG: hypothetical protein KF733_11110 [Fimbriimonadaceae bacterium]
MRHRLALVLATLAVSAIGLSSQARVIGSIAGVTAAARYSEVFGWSGETPTGSAVRLLRLDYDSDDGTGRVRTSGLLAVPANGAPRGLVVFFQGTTVDRAESPSRYRGTDPKHPMDPVVLAFTQHGYAVAAPDSYGLGDDRRPQPYIQGSVTSSSGIDIVEPARWALAAARVTTGPRLLVTGYSEGGAKAMWMTRRMESLGRRVDLSAPLSGPYDLSGTTSGWLVAPTRSAGLLAFKFVAAALVGYGASDRVPGLSLEEVFVPSFASYVPTVFEADQTTLQVAGRFMTKGTQLGGVGSIERILQPDTLRALRDRDEDHPLLRLLAANDCYDWEPKTKTMLAYLTTDDTVLPENTHRAMERMGHLAHVRAFSVEGSSLNHVTATVPCLVLARAFFDGGYAAVERIRRDRVLPAFADRDGG